MKKWLVAYVLILCCQLVGFSQSLTSENLEELKETLVFELNASLFIPGESLYLSLSCRNPRGEYSALSKVAYVEIINEENRSVLREKIGLVDGLGVGSIYLPSYLKTGSYTVIAYTRWMKNFSNQLIPQRAIKVVNPYEKLPTGLFSEKEPPTEVKAVFYPVDGYYVFGAKQQVNFRVTDQEGQGIPVTGKLANGAGEVVAEFASAEVGLGSFMLTLTENQTYQAVLVDAYENIHFVDVPLEKVSTISIALEESEGAFNLKGQMGQGTLEVWCRDEKVQTISGANEIALVKAELPKGMLTMRVLDANEQEVYQRMVYNPPTEVPVTLDLTTSLFKTRQKVGLIVGIMDSLQTGSYALSVRKKVATENENDLASSFFLGSASVRQDAKQQLLSELSTTDLLTFNAATLSENSAELTNLPDYRGNLIQGVLNDNRQQPMASTEISLSIPSRPYQFYTSKTNEQGAFFFTTAFSSYPGEYVFYVDGENVDSRIVLDEPYLMDHAFVDIQPFYLSPDLKAWLQQKSIEVQVENAYYQSKQDSVAPEGLPTFLADIEMRSYVLDDFTRFPTVEDHITELVAELAIRRKDDRVTFSFPFLANRSGEVDTVLALMNGIPVDPEEILAFNALELKQIDVRSKQVKLGDWEFAGIVNFQTYDPSLDLLKLPANHKRVSYQSPGPALSSEFTAPTYEDDALKRIPDFRSQLAWKPHLDLTQSTQVIEFYTSDSPGIYEVVLTGIIGNDQYILERIEFEVEE